MEHNEHEYCSGSYNEEFEDDIHEVVEVEGESLEKGTDELLIDAVRSYPHLYNSSLKEYKDTNMKENSWIEISKILDMSVSTCQNRWLRLRERFSKEKRLRELETRSGSGATHRPAFLLYHNFLFLESHIKQRKSYTNVSAAKKQLMDASSTSSLPDRINISRSNISLPQTVLSTNPNDSFPHSLSSSPSQALKKLIADHCFHHHLSVSHLIFLARVAQHQYQEILHHLLHHKRYPSI
ncbi:uncharacterized protein [Temnothorax longispinosus]|uniref:uncharacterized protein isoform X1 n=1 Tax=Temnothorax longispinosus TaxID=300112 RepID=UPI003A98E1D9